MSELNVLVGKKIIEVIEIEENIICIKFEKGTKKVVKKEEVIKIEMISSDVTIERYSPRSFLLSGNTFDHRSELKLMNGRWNRHLNGWIFGLKRITDIENYFNVEVSLSIKQK